MTAGGGYSDDFRVQVVDRFVDYFKASAGMTAAARSAAEDFGVSQTTVLKWADHQQRVPVPTWGEIRRLRAQNAQLSARVSDLENRD